MDYDLIANLSWNVTFNTDIAPDESMSMIFHEIVFSVICLVGIIADGLIIYILQRFKNMQSSTNVYIVNWLISDAVYLLLTPCFYRIFSALEDLFIGEEIVCISFEFASVLQITSIVFIGVLCINWFLTVYTVRFGRFSRIVVVGVWLAAAASIVTFSSFCVQQLYSLYSHYILFFGYAALMCTVAAMHVARYTTRWCDAHDKLRLNLTLVTVYVICWFPSWLCLLIASVIESYLLLYYLSIIAACLGYLNPLVNVYVFAKVNKNFRMCLLQVFRFVHRDYDDAADRKSVV